jgi:hypothetical protein
MPTRKLDTISACLWDLRARFEEQLRALTEAQRLADEYRRSQDGQRAAVHQQLVTHMDAILKSNGAVRETATDCAGLIHALSAERIGADST